LTQLTLNNGASPVSSLAYAYSDGMNLTGISDGLNAANNNVLWYTPANRLQNANGPWGNTTNYYDLVGNRTYNINTVGAVTTERIQTYAANSNRLNSMTENTAAFRSYTYDNAGNTLTETRPGESFAYTYNKRNRLAAVTRNTLAYAAYTYNALEQLTSRNTAAVGAPAGTVHYLYDQDGHLIAEANAATGATTRDYIWLASNDNDPIDLPLAIAETTTLTMVHADHLGRPTRMTDAAKSTVWQATWKPWGEIHSLSGTLPQNLRYPGQYYQIETGLHYNHHRMYDPITGRYTQADPLRFVDGPSVYAYAGSSPFMKTDREGLSHIRIRPNGSGPVIQSPGATLPHSPMPSIGWGSGSGAGSGSCGSCMPDEHRRLQDNVDYWCKNSGKFSCKRGMTQSQYSENEIVARNCASARRTINDICFYGGDKGHNKAAVDAEKAANKCLSAFFGRY
jgi:RHS repeat-associated protein